MMRRWTRALVLVGALCLSASVALTEDIGVPIALQVDLLDRLLWYERTLQKSAQQAMVVTVVVRAKDNESLRAAGQIEAQLDRLKKIGGRAVSRRRLVFESAEQLKRAVVEEQTYLLYFASGFGDVLPALANMLRGVRVLTVSTVGRDVERGAVLGFELVSSKPRVVLALARGRAQQLDFSAQLLRVARVVQ